MNVPNFVVADKGPNLQKLCQSLGNLASNRPALSVLGAFDCTLSDGEWAAAWSDLLNSSDGKSDLLIRASAKAHLPAAPSEAFDEKHMEPFESLNKESDSRLSSLRPNIETAAAAKRSDPSSAAEGVHDDFADFAEDKPDDTILPPTWGDLKTVPVSELNTFVKLTPGIFDQSADAKKLEVKGISARTLDVVRRKLECVLDEIYNFNVMDKGVVANLVAEKKSDFVTVSVPVSPDIKLPLIGHISQQSSKTSSKLINVFGIDFHMHQLSDARDREVVVPAWACKTVTRNDISYFVEDSFKAKIIMVRGHSSRYMQPPARLLKNTPLLDSTGGSSSGRDGAAESSDKLVATLLDPTPGADESEALFEANFESASANVKESEDKTNSKEGKQDHVEEKPNSQALLGNRSFDFDFLYVQDDVPEHCLPQPNFPYEVTINYLKPLPDIQAKLDADVIEQRKRIERSLRGMIKQWQKESEKQAKDEQKEKKRKKGTDDTSEKGKCNSKAAALIDALLPPNLPDDPQERVNALNKAIQTDAQIEALVTKAMEDVQCAKFIPLQKMASDVEKCLKSARARAMNEALHNAEAKAAAEQSEQQPQEDKPSAEAAAEQDVASMAGIGCAMHWAVKRGLAKEAVKAPKKATNKKEAEDIMKLGRHMLK